MESINKECPICQESPTSGQIIFTCKHLVCMKCFLQHIKKYDNCPLCRKTFVDKPYPLQHPPPLPQEQPPPRSRARPRTLLRPTFPARTSPHPVHTEQPQAWHQRHAPTTEYDDELTEEEFINPIRDITNSIRYAGEEFANVFIRTLFDSVVNTITDDPNSTIINVDTPTFPELRNAPPLRAPRYPVETNFCNKHMFWIGVVIDILLMTGYVLWQIS